MHMRFKTFTSFLLAFSYFQRRCNMVVASEIPTKCDIDLLQFTLNMRYLEAEFYLFGALGHGLDVVAPELTGGSPYPAIGAEKANLQWFVRDLVVQLAYQQIRHIRAIRNLVGGFPRPLMDLSATHFGQLMNRATGVQLQPHFNPYLNDINFLVACYFFPYISLTSYVGINSLLNDTSTKRILAGLAAVEAGQDAIIRTILYERALQPLYPYNYNVAEITDYLSRLRDQLAGLRGNTKKDGGIIVVSRNQSKYGGWTFGNVINGDGDSIAFSKAPWEILRIVYGTGSASRSGGFFPVGANGTIAQLYLYTTEANATTYCAGSPNHQP